MNVEMNAPGPFALLPLQPRDAAIYRALRLQGLRDSPEAFAASTGSPASPGYASKAPGVVEQIHLSVVSAKQTAIQLYAAAGFKQSGFKQYGLERRALRVDSRSYDEILMALSLGEGR
jgi:hypothetical protein